MTNAVALAQGASNNVTMRNRIINGAMVINQRYGTTAQTGVGGYVTDRFQVLNQSAGTVNAQTVTTAPAGFTYSTQLTVGTADNAVGSTDSVIFYQILEGYNIADFNWGTANAKTVTLSFWVYSSLVGTYSGSLVDNSGSVSFPFNYTISTANTWTQITQTITGPVSGTFGSTNNVGFYLEFSLMTGSSFQGTPNAWSAGNLRGTSSQVNWMATSGNTWLITGVQLEAGTTASPFEYRQYGTELSLCQRYCLVWDYAVSPVRLFGWNNTTSVGVVNLPIPVTLRSPPTGVTVTNASTMAYYASGTSYTVSSVTLDSNAGINTANLSVTTTGGLTVGAGNILGLQSAGNKIVLNGMEL